MKIFTLIARLLIGSIYFVFGLDYFFPFVSKIVAMPPISEGANNYLGALAATGYFFPLLKAVEVIGGVSLIIHKFTPLFAAVLVPVSLQIFLFDIFLAPQLLWLGGPLFITNIFLLIAYRKNYTQLFISTPAV